MMNTLRRSVEKLTTARRVKFYGHAAEAALQITAAHIAKGHEIHLEASNGQRYTIHADGTWTHHNASGN